MNLHELLTYPDFAFLFDARFEGIDKTEFASQAGVINLAFSEWFDPFRPGVSVHPFALE